VVDTALEAPALEDVVRTQALADTVGEFPAAYALFTKAKETSSTFRMVRA